MADDNSGDTSKTDSKDGKSGDTSTASTFEPIKSQEELNGILKDRLSRVESKYKDYNDLKAQAAEYQKLQKQNQTEAEKVAERLAKADQAEASIPNRVSEALKTHLIALHEISDEDAELFLTASDPDVLLKQVTRLVGRQDDKKKTGNRVSREGTNTNAAQPSDERETVQNLFGS